MSDILQAYKPYLPLVKRFCRQKLKKGDFIYYKGYTYEASVYGSKIGYPGSSKQDPSALLLKQYVKEHLQGNNSANLEYIPSKGFVGTANYTEYHTAVVNLDVPLPENVWFTDITINVEGHGGLYVRPQIRLVNGPIGPEHRELESFLATEIHRQIREQLKPHKARLDHNWMRFVLTDKDKRLKQTLNLSTKRYKKRDVEIPLTLKEKVVTLETATL